MPMYSAHHCQKVLNKQTYRLARYAVNVCRTAAVELVRTINTRSSIQTRIARTLVDI